MPHPPETSYFVNLDAPPPLSRHTPTERDWHQPTNVPPPPKRRRRRSGVRPVALLLVIPLAWIAWAYTTPGGPSARINDWINHTRGDVADVSASPSLHQTASYFDQLYATQGSYPNMSDSAIQADPNAGFGLSMSFRWCSGRAVVLGSLNAGGSISRLLLDGKDLGNVGGAQACPANLAHPAPWQSPKGSG